MQFIRGTDVFYSCTMDHSISVNSIDKEVKFNIAYMLLYTSKNLLLDRQIKIEIFTI